MTCVFCGMTEKYIVAINNLASPFATARR